MANTPVSAIPPADHGETYDEWFLRQVDEALAEADSPDAVWVSHEEILRDVERRRKEFLKRIGKNA